MTGLVEMASVPPWKLGLSNCNGDFEEFNEIDRNNSDSNTHMNEMLDIPTWKRELMSKKTKNVIQESKKTCVFDSSSISPVIDTNSNGIKPPHEPSKLEEKVNNVYPVKSDTSTSSVISSNSKMGTTAKSYEEKDYKDEPIRNSIETSHLKHVHSNPFFERLGVDHPHGHIYNDSAQSDMTNGITGDDNDMNEEYAPNSGFVDKLRLKFSKLREKSEKNNFKSSRRFASLESLVDVGKSKHDVKSTFEKAGDKNQRQHDNIKKTADYNIRTKLRSAPPPPVHRPRVSSTGSTTNDVVVAKNEQHVSSDFMKGRDDIVIIEHEVKDKPTKVKKTKDIPEAGSVHSLKEGKAKTDLPKPNTVITFRSLFEKRVTNTPKLPDFYASKFNLPKGKVPPKPAVPPRRVSQSAIETSSKVEKETIPNEKIESESEKDISTKKSSDMIEPTPAQTVKDLSQMFKQKPDRPFESPKTKRRSPEKKAIFDSSVITPVRNGVKEDDIIISLKEDSKDLSPRSGTIDKPAHPRKKPERVNRPKISPQSSVEEKSYKISKPIVSSQTSIEEVKRSSKEVNLNAEDKKPEDSTTLFPKRKQIFDSSFITETVSSPVAPPRVKGQKPKKQAPSIEDAEKNKTISSQSQKQTDSIKLKDRNEQEKPVNSRNVFSVEEINERNKQKQLEAEKHLQKISQKSVKVENNKKISNIPKDEDSKNNDTPTRGLPSIIANRLNKTDNNVNIGKGIIPLSSAKDESSEEEEEPRLVKPSHLRSTKSSSPNVPNKNNEENSSETLNFKNVLKSSKNNQVPRTNIDDLIGGRKNKKPSAVFDSSNIAVSPATNGVPPLNLSDLVNDKPLGHPYQEGYIATKIAPCNYVFEGAGVKLKTTPLVKRRTDKGKIKFHEDPRLHEYQSEGAALHDYLAQNPHEEVEAKKQHEETTVTMSLGGSLGDESSDDVDEPTTPREDSTIKSNTPLGGLSAGELTNYRSKYQTEDFQFGMSFSEPEPEPKKEEVEIEDYENRDIQPADEDSTINYTDSSITDMLF
ncbi:triadin-like isoform X1 [Mytilus edulis]|uniref:triadin-like isoform X1 n=1 Tax=Mytilus edulis TaxID=6550 RepID=UPI0039F057B4